MFNSYSFNSTGFNSFSEEGSGPAENEEIVLEEVSTSTDIIGDIAYLPTIEETINVILYQTIVSQIPVHESFSVSSTLESRLIAQIIESLVVSEAFSSTAEMASTVEDAIAVRDLMGVIYPLVVEEGIEVAETVEDLLRKFVLVRDKAELLGAVATSAQLSATIAASIVIQDIVLYNRYVNSLEDDVEVAETVVDTVTRLTSILEAMSVDDEASNYVSLFVVSEDDLEVSEDVDTVANLQVSLSDQAVFLVTYDNGDTVYQGYAYFPETTGITEYTNYSFNSSAFFNQKYLLANESGLYLSGGGLDEEAYIVSKITTAALDLETSNLKQVPKVYLGISNDASLILTVKVDGKHEARYKLDLSSENLETQMINIGKGLVGRYWQFSLETQNSSSLNLDDIELYPLQFGRKRR